MKKLFLSLAMGALLGLVLVIAGSSYVAARYSTEVVFITANGPEAIALERMLWEEGDPVAPIYGVPASDPQRILFAKEETIIRPPEDPSLALYPVDKEAGENPLQEKTLWFFARYAVLGFSLLAFGALTGFVLVRRREGRS
jgi:hypothetical protein